MKKWKTIASEKLFEHPRLTVYEDVVELPNRSQTNYLHFGTMPDSGMVLARNDEGKFLIQKEYSYPPDEFLFQLPGGNINPGEDPAIGAARELAEESGIGGIMTEIGWFYLHNRRSNQKMYVYLAEKLFTVAAEGDDEEAFEEFWLDESEIDRMITNGEIVNYTLLAGWALYKAKK